MAEQNYTPYGAGAGANCFKEAVCVNSGRIYDSCSDKDCLENLRVYFSSANQGTINEAQTIKVRKVEVFNVLMEVESVPFNKGFYSVDTTFYFLITLATYPTQATTTPTAVQGISVFSKKVILYGAEGSVKNFTSADGSNILTNNNCLFSSNTPTSRIQVVDPIILASRITESPLSETDINNPEIPETIPCLSDDTFVTGETARYVYVSIGLFSIVQLEREVQMMIPVYDYSIPDKECANIENTYDPCELFRKIKFPVNEFFPPRLTDVDCNDDPTL